MQRIRVAQFDSTTVEDSETTRIAAGEVTTKRRLRVTRNRGSIFELIVPGLFVSGSVMTVSASDDMPVSERRKLPRADDRKALPAPTVALDGPKKDGKQRLLK